MESIVYFLKQEQYGRVKIGSTKNMETRLKNLEKEWGQFDENSELVYFNDEEFKSNSLSLNNIERTIQRILKSKNLHFEMSDKKDGFTEFFHLDEMEIINSIKPLGHLVEKKVFLSAFRRKNANKVKSKIKEKKYYLQIQEENQIYMMNKRILEKEKKNSHLDHLFKREKNFNLKTIIKKSGTIKKLQEVDALDLREYRSFSFCYDYNDRKMTFVFNMKEKKEPKFSIYKTIHHVTSIDGGWSAITRSAKSDMTIEEIYLGFYRGGIIDYHERYYMFKLIQIFKKKLPLLPFHPKYSRLEMLKKHSNKLYYKKIWDGKFFKIKYKKNSKEAEKHIDIHTIVEYCIEPDFFEILLTNGEMIKFYHEVNFIEDGYGTYKEERDIGSPCLTKKEVSDYMRNKSFISSRDSDFLFHIMGINNIYWYYKSEGKEPRI